MAGRRGTSPASGLAAPPLGKIYTVLLAGLLAIAAPVALLDLTWGYSVLLGGLISALPNIYFARQAFRYRGARSAHYVTRAFYLGEAGKFTMTTVAFGLVFAKVERLQPIALVLAFLGMTLGHLIVCARFGAYGRTGEPKAVDVGKADQG